MDVAVRIFLHRSVTRLATLARRYCARVAYLRARFQVQRLQTVVGRGAVQRRKYRAVVRQATLVQNWVRRRQALRDYRRKQVAGAAITRAGRGFQGRTWFKARLGTLTLTLTLILILTPILILTLTLTLTLNPNPKPSFDSSLSLSLSLSLSSHTTHTVSHCTHCTKHKDKRQNKKDKKKRQNTKTKD
jgi:hypothetical protein